MNLAYENGKHAGLANVARMLNPHDPIVEGVSFQEWNRGHADGLWDLRNPQPAAIAGVFRPIIWDASHEA